LDSTLAISWVGVVAALVMAVFWIIFLFYSVRRIERGIVSEGKQRPCQWDPMGLRAFFYASKVAFPLKVLKYLDDGLIEPQDVKRYSSNVDFWLASILVVAWYTLGIVILVSWIFGL